MKNLFSSRFRSFQKVSRFVFMESSEFEDTGAEKIFLIPLNAEEIKKEIQANPKWRKRAWKNTKEKIITNVLEEKLTDIYIRAFDQKSGTRYLKGDKRDELYERTAHNVRRTMLLFRKSIELDAEFTGTIDCINQEIQKMNEYPLNNFSAEEEKNDQLLGEIFENSTKVNNKKLIIKNKKIQNWCEENQYDFRFRYVTYPSGKPKLVKNGNFGAELKLVFFHCEKPVTDIKSDVILSINPVINEEGEIIGIRTLDGDFDTAIRTPDGVDHTYKVPTKDEIKTTFTKKDQFVENAKTLARNKQGEVVSIDSNIVKSTTAAIDKEVRKATKSTRKKVWDVLNDKNYFKGLKERTKNSVKALINKNVEETPSVEETPTATETEVVQDDLKEVSSPEETEELDIDNLDLDLDMDDFNNEPPESAPEDNSNETLDFNNPALEDEVFKEFDEYNPDDDKTENNDENVIELTEQITEETGLNKFWQDKVSGTPNDEAVKILNKIKDIPEYFIGEIKFNETGELQKLEYNDPILTLTLEAKNSYFQKIIQLLPGNIKEALKNDKNDNIDFTFENGGIKKYCTYSTNIDFLDKKTIKFLNCPNVPSIKFNEFPKLEGVMIKDSEFRERYYNIVDGIIILEDLTNYDRMEYGVLMEVKEEKKSKVLSQEEVNSLVDNAEEELKKLFNSKSTSPENIDDDSDSPELTDEESSTDSKQKPLSDKENPKLDDEDMDLETLFFRDKAEDDDFDTLIDEGTAFWEDKKDDTVIEHTEKTELDKFWEDKIEGNPSDKAIKILNKIKDIPEYFIGEIKFNEAGELQKLEYGKNSDDLLSNPQNSYFQEIIELLPEDIKDALKQDKNNAIDFVFEDGEIKKYCTYSDNIDFLKQIAIGTLDCTAVSSIKFSEFRVKEIYGTIGYDTFKFEIKNGLITDKDGKTYDQMEDGELMEVEEKSSSPLDGFSWDK